MTDLTKKKDKPNNIKDWQDHHEKAFQTLKNRLTSSPILRLPVFREGVSFILGRDASDTGLGAALLQEFEVKANFLLLTQAGNWYIERRIIQ